MNTPHPARLARIIPTSLLALLVSLRVPAQTESTAALAELSLEELMNESVTSVGRKSSRLVEAPAAVSVITEVEVERSGLTSIPELLRLVPGVSVARIHGNEWAVTARGFNAQYANKLLVLVDGRSVYSPMFGGVYWNTQDTIVEDLERIEVIRGPGATLWGVNAVNGVVNVTSKSAEDTQGGMVRIAFGTEDRPSASVRYGGKAGSTAHYRVYARSYNRRGFASGADDWNTAAVGGRLDWQPEAKDLFTLQGDYYRGSVGEHFEGVSLTPPFVVPLDLVHHNFGGNLIGRWTRTYSPVSALILQFYADRFHQGDGDSTETRSTFDLELQHRLPWGTRHDIVWGAGFRATEDRMAGTFYLSFDPERERDELYTAFVQDEITLVPERLKLSVGAKIERNSYTGFEFQPSVRVAWTPERDRAAWAAVSRAARTPARYDRNARLNTAAFPVANGTPFLVSLLSHPDADSEELTAYEAGFRWESGNFSADLALFLNVYDGILGYVEEPVVFETEPAPAHLLLPLHFRNVNSGETYGGEISLEGKISERWRLRASYSLLHMQLSPQESAENESPKHQAQVHSTWQLTNELGARVSFFYTSSVIAPLENTTVEIPAHLRCDVGVNWQMNENFEVGVWGQNLIDPRHPEFGTFKGPLLTEVPRSFLVRAIWRF